MMTRYWYELIAENIFNGMEWKFYTNVSKLRKSIKLLRNDRRHKHTKINMILSWMLQDCEIETRIYRRIK